MVRSIINREIDLKDQEAARAQQQEKNQTAIRLIEEWLADESGYEEENWPQIEEAISEVSRH